MNAYTKRSLKRNIKHLTKELELVTSELDKLIKADESLNSKRKLLKSIKGFGPEVTSILITDLPELGSITREEISHLVGVAPRTKDSGKKSSKRSICKGRFYVRKALFMATLVASRFNPRMRSIYQRILAAGKMKKVALVAIIRKMIIMANVMVRTNTPWQSDRI